MEDAFLKVWLETMARKPPSNQANGLKTENFQSLGSAEPEFFHLTGLFRTCDAALLIPSIADKSGSSANGRRFVEDLSTINAHLDHLKEAFGNRHERVVADQNMLQIAGQSFLAKPLNKSHNFESNDDTSEEMKKLERKLGQVLKIFGESKKRALNNGESSVVLAKGSASPVDFTVSHKALASESALSRQDGITSIDHIKPDRVGGSTFSDAECLSSERIGSLLDIATCNESEDRENSIPTTSFVSARDKYFGSMKSRGKEKFNPQSNNSSRLGQTTKRRRTFIPPARVDENNNLTANTSQPLRQSGGLSRLKKLPCQNATRNRSLGGSQSNNAIRQVINNVSKNSGENDGLPEEYANEARLRGMDPSLIERIESEVLQSGDPVKFSDIAGLQFAKDSIEEIIVWPLRNPEYYTGLRQLPKGLLLFGPPGTGKTLIGKAIAHEVSATFFAISASSLTSKWIGEGEKMVRALFGVAAAKQPSVIFIDEVDSLLCMRSSDDNEASRRMKTEFLVQLDGAGSNQDDHILVIGATNRPQELDDAARRRFIKRLYIPLPDKHTRIDLLRKLLAKNENNLTQSEIDDLCSLTDGYSGADITNLAREACMGPLRDKMRRRGNRNGTEDSSHINGLRPMNNHDFKVAMRSIRASVSQDDLAVYTRWNHEFGTQQYHE